MSTKDDTIELVKQDQLETSQQAALRKTTDHEFDLMAIQPFIRVLKSGIERFLYINLLFIVLHVFACLAFIF